MKTMHEAVLRKQINLLYAQSQTTLLAGSSLVLFVTFYYWQVVESSLFLSWFAAFLLLNGARFSYNFV